eukprot:1148597-Pelagomonas_calceolata.AAC.7
MPFGGPVEVVVGAVKTFWKQVSEADGFGGAAAAAAAAAAAGNASTLAQCSSLAGQCSPSKVSSAFGCLFGGC